MTVDFAYNIFLLGLQKNKQQGYASPDDFNNYINIAQLGMLQYLLGESQSYQPGRPIPRVQYGMNETVRQRLTPFIQSPVSLTIDATGFVAYPGDYQQTDAMYQPNMERVRYVPQHKLPSTLKSQIDPIATNPIFLIEDEGFRFYPNATYNGVAFSAAQLSYVRTPKTIVWAYIPDPGTGLPVYNPGASQDPEWYDVDMMEVIVRAFALAGVNLQIPQVQQYAQMIKTQGQ